MAREIHVDRAIRGERETRALDAAIAIIAARQHPLHRGVYAVGHRNLSRASGTPSA
jgi:hypothetical protein